MVEVIVTLSHKVAATVDKSENIEYKLGLLDTKCSLLNVLALLLACSLHSLQ